MTIDPAGESPWPLVYVVSGPSGAGKTSLCARALQDLDWIRPSVSHTTRPPRPGEVHGKEYFFVDRPRFLEMARHGEFLEWAEVHGECYGTSLGNLEAVSEEEGLLFEVDCQGALAIQRRLPASVLIFVMTPSFEDLVARIRNRGAITPRELEIRIGTATVEVRRARAFQYVVINDRFPEASRRFQAILEAERCLAKRILPRRADRWEAEMRVFGSARSASSPGHGTTGALGAPETSTK